MNIVLVDGRERDSLKPFTFLRPVAEIRIGMLTISEKWRRMSGAQVSYLAHPSLQEIYPPVIEDRQIFINGAVLPAPDLLKAINNLGKGETLEADGDWIAAVITAGDFEEGWEACIGRFKKVAYAKQLLHLKEKWDIFQLNGDALKADFDLLTKGRKSAAVPEGTVHSGNQLFIEDGAVLRPCIINSGPGPVYIAAGAEVMEGCMIRGGLYLGEGSQLKMGTKIYGPTTIGPHCKIGGEVTNCVIFGYSNKGHDGFLGNSVLGEWCNLGADTNTSNLKNNYSNVRVFDYASGRLENSGLQFCGLMMGDHSKCSINTMFNTGTVTGIFCNIFGSGFPPKYVPSFAWGEGEVFEADKAIDMAKKVMQRRSVSLVPTVEKTIRSLHPDRM